MMFRRYNTILFDMDGTLIDTNHIWDKYTVEVLLEEGLLKPDRVEWFLRLRRFGGDAVSEAFPELSPEEVNTIYEKTRERALRHADEIKPLFSRDELLSLLEGKASGIITQTHRRVARRFLKAVGFLDLFDTIVSSDRVKNVKPHPEPIFRALEEVGECPATYIGDSEADERAALSAGIDFYHVEAVKRYVRGYPL